MNLIFIEAESFDSIGGWVIDQQSIAQMGSAYLMAHGMGIPVEDAHTSFSVKAEGVYTVWARTRDWTAAWDGCGSAGRFALLMNGRALEAVLGTNGPEWRWQRAGRVHLGQGRHTLALHDLTGFNGRCDAVLLAAEDAYAPPDDPEALARLRQELTWREVREETREYDLVVVGGGVAGLCMALSAKRMGASVLLINDREVLGGCNSSEVRVCMGGQIHLPPYKRLGDVVKEIAPVMGSPDIFGASYYEDDRKRHAFELREQNPAPHSLRLGEHAIAIGMEGAAIRSVETVNIRTGAHTRFFGKLFADCTGDAILSRLAGCEVMYGREGQDAFGETLAAETYEQLVMGHSLRWYSTPREERCAFPHIDWGIPFDEDSCYHVRNGDWEQEAGFRRDMIEEIEYIRDLGLRAIFSNWHFQKNVSARRAEYSHDALAWISPIGGKRESYRVVGDHILTQQDIETPVIHPDATACMTWSIDIHFPEPDNEARFGEAFRSFAYHRGIVQPYPVPYRCLYARDVRNLFLGGRDISTSHVAFSAIRVMRTLGALGEVAGMAAAICARRGITPRALYEDFLPELKAAMAEGVPSPDAFACGCGAEESYHFKDIGWIRFDKYACDTPERLDKFKRNIRQLRLAHKYPFPEGFWD